MSFTKQQRIFNVIRSLECIPKVTITKSMKDESINGIIVHHRQEYVPDFRLEWCSAKEHYRVYIYVAHTRYEKQNAGYCVCVIGSSLAATGFATLYNFLHTHRYNNKEQ